MGLGPSTNILMATGGAASSDSASGGSFGPLGANGRTKLTGDAPTQRFGVGGPGDTGKIAKGSPGLVLVSFSK